ncbi:MAG: epoxide hydrolase N-terminal domain-containing protein [bacterium]
MSVDPRPYRIAVPAAALTDLQDRLARTRWPEAATVADWTQGVPLPVVQELCTYWQNDYDWRATERRLNRWPQYRTVIDGLAIHYFHLPSADPAAVTP